MNIFSRPGIRLQHSFSLRPALTLLLHLQSHQHTLQNIQCKSQHMQLHRTFQNKGQDSIFTPLSLHAFSATLASDRLLTQQSPGTPDAQKPCRGTGTAHRKHKHIGTESINTLERPCIIALYSKERHHGWSRLDILVSPCILHRYLDEDPYNCPNQMMLV
jgi:hypothetical protein